jgi:dephospho-CoA kinase
MLKIGLTGGIGAGKSTVARIFENLGAEIYYADERAKNLMESDTVLINQIKYLLGADSYVSGKLNSGFISGKVFNEKSLLEKLNKIVHPAVRDDFVNWCNKRKKEPYVIEEAALLFETGFYLDFDYTILVTAPMELRIQRVVKRDNTERDMVEKRINNQFSEAEKLHLCDFEIKNDEKKMLIPQVLDLHNKFVSLQKL